MMKPPDLLPQYFLQTDITLRLHNREGRIRQSLLEIHVRVIFHHKKRLIWLEYVDCFLIWG